MKISTKDRPSNLFLINNAKDAKSAVIYIERNLITECINAQRLEKEECLTDKGLLEEIHDPEKGPEDPTVGPIIVFGDCLEAYCCVEGLLQMGIPGIRIILMHPYRKLAVGLFRT